MKEILYPIDEINSLSDKSTLTELGWLIEYKTKSQVKKIDTYLFKNLKYEDNEFTFDVYLCLLTVIIF